MNRLLVVPLLAAVTAALAQEKPPPPVSAPLAEARKRAAAELNKMREAMAKKGYKAEVGDCESILGKLFAPSRPMGQKGAFSPYPGDKEYEEVLTAWSEMGTALSGIYRDAAAGLKDKELEEAQTFADWFATFGELAKGVRHLNKRRKFCRLPPVTLDWSGSLGGFLHGIYLKLNRDHPSTQGLGAHNEDPKLPGHTPEGAEAAGGILGGGTAESIMDSWLMSRFHRDPVFSRTCGRIAFGGLPGGWWSCRSAGGMAGKTAAEAVTFPGDGDTEIPTEFGGEAPNPFPPGMTSSGTLVVVEFTGRQPKKPSWRLLDPDGREVPIVTLDKMPICFVAKTALKGRTKYSVEVTGIDGYKLAFSFTTR
jgi:hypothetical protein